MTPKLRLFLDEVRPATPYLVLDVDVVEANYQALTTALDGVAIFFAVKANPAPEILRRLVELGSSFDGSAPAASASATSAGLATSNEDPSSTRRRRISGAGLALTA